MSEKTTNQQIRLAGLSLFLIFIGIYSLSYLGLWLGTDELHMFDSTESLVKHGNFDVTIQYLTNYTPQEYPGEIGTPSRYEPMQMILAAPLYYVTSQLPQVGMMHAVWFLNIVITAATVLCLYVIAIHQGYTWQIAWAGSFMYGFGTQVLPYSRWFFRDPLSALTIIVFFGLALKLRRNLQEGTSYWVLGMGLAIVYLVAFFSKQVVLLILPSFFILVLDKKVLRGRHNWIFGLGFLGLAGLALYSIFFIDLSRSRQLGFFYDIEQQMTWLFESFMGYMFSPSRSIWLYSPIILLVVPGSIILWRKHDKRLVLSVWASFVVFTLSYGFRHGWNWWGSWSWGPRYLLPILPILFLLIFPVLNQIEQSSRRFVWRISTLSLFLISIAVQLVGMGVSYSNYYSELELADVFLGKKDEKRWEYYNWDWDKAPFAYHLKHFEWDHIWTWNVSQPSWLVPSLAIFTIGFGLVLVVWQRSAYLSLLVKLAGLASLILPVCLLSSMLYTLRDDPRYTSDKQHQDVRQLIIELNNNAADDEIIFIERLSDMVLFMNYAKHYSWLITLPSAPGEQYGDIQPTIITDNLHEQTGFRNIYALEWSETKTETAWLVTSYSPFHTQQLRPIEHYMSENYFPTSEIYLTPEARAVRYLIKRTPLNKPTIFTQIKFGSALQLVGYDLYGEEFTGGDVVPLSLLWQVDEPLPLDYNIGVLVLSPDGQLVADRNGIPQGTFGQTSQWEPLISYRDNHGLALPEDLPPGEYTIEIVIYYWQDLQNLPVTQDGEAVGEFAVITTITVK